MKRIVLIIVIFFTISTSSSQEVARKFLNEKKNELKIDMIRLLAEPSIEIEYERIISSLSSIGGLIKMGGGADDFSRKFRLGGFYRGYFTQSQEYGTKGFYGELMSGYYLGNEEIYYYDIAPENYPDDPITYNGLEVGFKLGYKWVNRIGFLIQVDLGISRGFFKSDNSPENFLLSGIKLGWRF